MEGLFLRGEKELVDFLKGEKENPGGEPTLEEKEEGEVARGEKELVLEEEGETEIRSKGELIISRGELFEYLFGLFIIKKLLLLLSSLVVLFISLFLFKFFGLFFIKFLVFSELFSILFSSPIFIGDVLVVLFFVSSISIDDFISSFS